MPIFCGHGGFFGQGEVPQHFYGMQSASQSIKLAAKFLLNMLLAFSAPVEIKQVLHSLSSLTGVALLLVVIAAASFVWVTTRQLFLTIGWIAISMAPSAVLGWYTDRYLSLPFVGGAMLTGFAADGLVRRAPAKVAVQLMIFTALGAYVVMSIFRLTYYERTWKEAAGEIQTTMNEARRLHPQVPERSVFYFVNVTHIRASGQVFEFNNNLNETLWAAGYPQSVTAERTFASDDPREQRLVEQLLTCHVAAKSETTRYVFVSQNSLLDVTGDCGEQTVTASHKQQPDLWE